jgi:hypothetical protein
MLKTFVSLFKSRICYFPLKLFVGRKYLLLTSDFVVAGGVFSGRRIRALREQRKLKSIRADK